MRPLFTDEIKKYFADIDRLNLDDCTQLIVEDALENASLSKLKYLDSEGKMVFPLCSERYIEVGPFGDFISKVCLKKEDFTNWDKYFAYRRALAAVR